MDRQNLAEANGLLNQVQVMELVAKFLDEGGKIVSMRINDPNSGPESGAMISTVDWDYPQTMTDAIKTLLAANIASINDQLKALGVE